MAVLKSGDIEGARQNFLECRNLLREMVSTQAQTEANAPLTNLEPVRNAIPRKNMAMAVRYTLYVLERVAPGPGVEVRVAPYAAVKILEGPASDPHNLTPPDVIELEPWVWMRMACGITTWAQEKAAGHISAVGERDDLSRLLPIEA
ncbi:MAG: sterol carrier family protein [Bifidobacteriaceae bacterium]|jgi:hypothetical protein|nr:sterol carrier family protein [Bifidobacteriaceae bacterium]MCI1979020.1 sterol carrier family protein [Bifidobacteriaceae bacterium]